MTDPIINQEDVTQPVTNAPFPLGERRADDVRDAAFLTWDDLQELLSERPNAAASPLEYRRP